MSDWTTDAADLIERTVATLRDRTVAPAHAAIRVRRLRPARGADRDPRADPRHRRGLPRPRPHLPGLRLGGLADARRNLRGRRRVLLDQAQTHLNRRHGQDRQHEHESRATSSSSARARPGSPPRSTPRAPTCTRSSSKASRPAASSCSRPTSRTSPASPTASSGPSSWRSSGSRPSGSAPSSSPPTSTPSTSRSRRSRVRVGDAEYDARSIIISTGAQARMLGLAVGAAAARPRRLHVRDLRRVLLPRPRHRGRRRRRLRDRGGDLPHPVRRQGHDRAPAQGAARVEDHAGPRVREPEDRVPLEQRRRRRRRRRSVEELVLRDTETGASSDLAVTGVFVAIGHDPNTKLFTGQLELDDNGYIVTQPGTRRKRRSRACSPPATCKTTCTVRRSPPPAPAAWLRSKPSATSKRSVTRRATV